jgi:heme-degrading monooxygenase HmoA
MIIQIVKFESALSEKEVMATAKERAPQFQAIPGLVQKYYAKLGRPNQYAGIYLWESMESLNSYLDSDLAASIPDAYKVKGQPTVDILDTVFQLRE